MTTLTQAVEQTNHGWDCAYQVVAMNAQRGFEITLGNGANTRLEE